MCVESGLIVFPNSVVEDDSEDDGDGDDYLKCLVCKKNSINVRFLPCEHLNICSDCLMKKHPRYCMTCYTPLEATYSFTTI
jgi:hypothetical protein